MGRGILSFLFSLRLQNGCHCLTTSDKVMFWMNLLEWRTMISGGNEADWRRSWALRGIFFVCLFCVVDRVVSRQCSTPEWVSGVKVNSLFNPTGVNTTVFIPLHTKGVLKKVLGHVAVIWLCGCDQNKNKSPHRSLWVREQLLHCLLERKYSCSHDNRLLIGQRLLGHYKVR